MHTSHPIQHSCQLVYFLVLPITLMWWKNTVKGKMWNSDYESLSGTLDSLSFIISFSLYHPFCLSNIFFPSLPSKGENERCLLWDFSYYIGGKSSFCNSQEVIIYTVPPASSTFQHQSKCVKQHAETLEQLLLQVPLECKSSVVPLLPTSAILLITQKSQLCTYVLYNLTCSLEDFVCMHTVFTE